MFKNVHKVIAAVAVFAMTIGSGFAMDTNPPSEPVKVVVETEVVETNLQTPTAYTGRVGYIDIFNNHVEILPSPTHCSLDNDYPECKMLIGGTLVQLYTFEFDLITLQWKCTQVLYRLTP